MKSSSPPLTSVAKSTDDVDARNQVRAAAAGQQSVVHAVDGIVRRAAESFADEIAASRWFGRENEAVNLFAFRYLVRECRRGTLLHDPAQRGIEVAVPQLSRPGKKRQLHKDLVIWPRPGKTCWDSSREPTQRPLAIVEWKVREREMSARDLDWLAAFSRGETAFVAYAFLLWPRNSARMLYAARIFDGVVDSWWLEAGDRRKTDAPREK